MSPSPKRFSLPAFLGVFPFSSQNLIRALIALSVYLFTLALFHWQTLERFELVLYDVRCRLEGSRSADPRIAAIEISNDSIQKIGRWPWSRGLHAVLIQILDELGAKAVVFDVFFPEPSDPEKDRSLAEAIRRSGKVYLAEVVDYSPTPGRTKLLTSLPEFVADAKGGGHVNLEPDPDGVMRRVPLFIEYGGRRIPQLAFSVALDEWGVRSEEVQVKGQTLVVPLPGGHSLRVPLDSRKQFVIHWLGRWRDKNFKHYSYHDVLSSYYAAQKGQKPKIPLEELKGKICFVGATATGLFDVRPTPLEPAYFALGANLTVLNNLLERRFIRPLGFWPEAGILALLALCLFGVMRLESYWQQAAAALFLAAGYWVLNFLVFWRLGVWASVVYALVLIFTTYFFVAFYNQVAVTLERARLFRLATRDSLTSLYNIGHFKLLMKAEMGTLAMRGDKKLSICMADVDDFKRINDTFGHLMGDQVLKEVALCVRQNCRVLDVAARYGGEEFIVMLPGASLEEAAKIAEKIRKAIHERIFTHDDGRFQVSISIGVTPVSPRDKDVEGVVARADQALYQAKHSGKNRVVVLDKVLPNVI